MKFQHLIKSRAAAPSALSLVVAIVATACGGGGGSSGGGGGGMAGIADPPATGGFTDMALVSDNDTVVASATTIDANLQNPWGIAVAPGLPIWIADNNSNLSTLYSGTGEV